MNHVERRQNGAEYGTILGARTATNEAVRRGCDPTPDLAATSRKGDALASEQTTAPDPTSVYRYYDRAGMLIYVGITRQGMGRNLQHNGGAEWWEHVSSQEVEHYPTRKQAADREKALIRQYRPPFNKQHNIGYRELREAYQAVASTPWVHSAPIELYHRLGKMLPLDFVSRADRELVLRTRREHAPLAGVLVVKNGGVPLMGNRGMGGLKEIRTTVGYTFLIFKPKPDCPMDITGGIAHIALQPTKPPVARLDKVTMIRAA